MLDVQMPASAFCIVALLCFSMLCCIAGLVHCLFISPYSSFFVRTLAVFGPWSFVENSLTGRRDKIHNFDSPALTRDLRELDGMGAWDLWVSRKSLYRPLKGGSF